MLDSRSVFAGGIAGFATALLIVGFVGCQKKDEEAGATSPKSVETAPGLPPQSADELSTPVATVDDVVITVNEFQDIINRQSPYIRARYTSLEQKKEFLQSLIQFEVLAKEATRRGFDKDPEVVRTMKQVMIQKLMKEEFEEGLKPEDISEQDMQTFFAEHANEYNRPEQVRASVIVLDSKAKADEVAKDAKGEAGKNNTGFRQLVNVYSTDETTKLRGGDLRYFDRASTEFPKPVIEAAFALEKTGDVVGPVDGGNGKFYFIKLTGRREPLVRTFEEVKRQIQNRVYRDKRASSQEAFIEGLKSKAQISVNEDNLGKVRIDTSGAGEGGPAHGGHGTMPSFDDLPKPPSQ